MNREVLLVQINAASSTRGVYLFFLLIGGGRGIRTPVGFRPNGFQDRLVMTTSISLQTGKSDTQKCILYNIIYFVICQDLFVKLFRKKRKMGWFWLTKKEVCVIICRQLCRTAARYDAERFYREESPGFAGQDS